MNAMRKYYTGLARYTLSLAILTGFRIAIN